MPWRRVQGWSRSPYPRDHPAFSRCLRLCSTTRLQPFWCTGSLSIRGFSNMTMISANRSPQGIARDLEALHGECRAAMSVMQSLIDARECDGVRVPVARHRMSHASTRRLKFLSEVAYPCVLQSATASQVEAIRALQAQATANRSRSSAHVAKWSTAGVSADWNAFRRESAGMLAMMADRLKQEGDVLLPMLMAAVPPRPLSQRV